MQGRILRVYLIRLTNNRQTTFLCRLSIHFSPNLHHPNLPVFTGANVRYVYLHGHTISIDPQFCDPKDLAAGRQKHVAISLYYSSADQETRRSRDR